MATKQPKGKTPLKQNAKGTNVDALNDMDFKYLCEKMCRADKIGVARFSKRAKDGFAVYKQLAVYFMIRYDWDGHKGVWPWVPEVSYKKDKVNGGFTPVLEKDVPHGKKDALPNEPHWSWIDVAWEQIAGKMKFPMKGTIRPDVVILDAKSDFMPTTNNIMQVVEMKFGKDKVKQYKSGTTQTDKYLQLVNNDDERVTVLTPNDCDCGDDKDKDPKEQPQTQPETAPHAPPVLLPAPRTTTEPPAIPVPVDEPNAPPIPLPVPVYAPEPQPFVYLADEWDEAAEAAFEASRRRINQRITKDMNTEIAREKAAAELAAKRRRAAAAQAAAARAATSQPVVRRGQSTYYASSAPPPRPAFVPPHAEAAYNVQESRWEWVVPTLKQAATTAAYAAGTALVVGALVLAYGTGVGEVVTACAILVTGTAALSNRYGSDWH